MKAKGKVSQPTPRNKDKNTISTGIVIMKSVIMTVRKLGLADFIASFIDEGRADAASACNIVDKRETKTEPTAPGRPGFIRL